MLNLSADIERAFVREARARRLSLDELLPKRCVPAPKKLPGNPKQADVHLRNSNTKTACPSFGPVSRFQSPSLTKRLTKFAVNETTLFSEAPIEALSGFLCLIAKCALN
jgi:hypothetical protein